MVFVMSEEQLKAAKAAETEKVEAQVEEAVEEISEEDLDGVVGGVSYPYPTENMGPNRFILEV